MILVITVMVEIHLVLNKKDKTMKVKYNLIGMAAFALTAATLTACSIEDEPIAKENPASQGNVVTLTATLSPKGGVATTRALTDPGDGTLTSTWAVGEEIWVNYEDNGGTSPTAKARVTSVNAGVATVTVDLVDPKDDTQIDFNYPYALIAVEKDIYYDQLGTLADVSANYDMCSGSGTLHVDAGVATLPTGVTMTRDVFIWKFTFTDGSNDITSQITSLVVDDGMGCPYTISPSGQSTIYVAMYGGMGETTYTITGATGSGIYTKTQGDISLVNGKLYTSTGVALTAAAEVNLASKTADYTASNGDVLTGTLDPNYKLIIPMDAVVMLKNAHIDFGGYDDAAITCEGNATIVIADGTTNTVTVPGDQGGGPGNSGSPYPGILASPYGNKLTFKGNTGELNVIGGYIASGIGCLNVGGANGMGASYTAYDGRCGVIQIDGGVISSYSGNKSYLGDGAETGIGNVCGGSADLCEGIIINGGTVTAKGGTAGIGSSGSADVGFITINGGTVTATGGNDSPGIGAGPDADCGPITINGGTVTAIGGGDAAGIGSGGGSSSYTSLTIASGITKVTATRGGNGTAEPIGHGKEDTTSPAPVFSGVTKDAVNSTNDKWIYE